MGALEPGDGEETEADVAADSKIDDEFNENEDDPQDESLEDEGLEEDEDGFGAERELCHDDTCVGVINLEGVCGDCGKVASIASAQATVRAKRESTGQGGAVDFLHRSLCPDGSCVGVVGPDGRCKECGLVGEQVLTDPRLRGLKTPAIEDSDDAPAEPPVQDQSLPSLGDGIEVMASPEEFADRQLCPDGSCIGVIGPQGTCKECGSAA